jgi:hypothetical protein
MAIRRDSNKSFSRWCQISIVLISAWLLVSATQAEAKTMKFRNVGHIAKAEIIEVADVEGHYIGAYERKGLAFHDKGEIAIQFCKGTFDSSGGITSYQGHSILHFQDGSTVSMKYQGESKPASGGKMRTSEATFEFTTGTGRFEGIKGKGSFSGMEPRFLKGFKGYAYFDFTGTYTVSSK